MAAGGTPRRGDSGGRSRPGGGRTPPAGGGGPAPGSGAGPPEAHPRVGQDVAEPLRAGPVARGDQEPAGRPVTTHDLEDDLARPPTPPPGMGQQREPAAEEPAEPSR